MGIFSKKEKDSYKSGFKKGYAQMAKKAGVYKPKKRTKKPKGKTKKPTVIVKHFQDSLGTVEKRYIQNKDGSISTKIGNSVLTKKKNGDLYNNGRKISLNHEYDMAIKYFYDLK